MPLLRSARRPFGWLLSLAVVACCLAIAAGFFGAQIHAFDSLGHFRAHFSGVLIVLVLVCLITRRWLAATIAAAGGVAGFASTLPFLLPFSLETPPRPGAATYSLLQMNLRFNAEDRSPALRTIAATRPDIITLQEVTRDWRSAFATLKEAYPYQAFCGSYGVGGSGILSRRPFASPAANICEPDEGFLARGVDFNGQTISVAALHLEWPWPHKQWQQIDHLASILPALGQPAILGGDFNAAPWSAAVSTLADAGHLSVQRGIGPSWMNYDFPALSTRWFGLPIDNVLVAPEIIVTSVGTLAATSSDHLPVLVRFVLPKAPPEPTVGVAATAPVAAPRG